MYYVEGKQTLSQLAAKYGVIEKTIRRDPPPVYASETMQRMLENKVRVPSGISKENRKKLLDEHIKRHY